MPNVPRQPLAEVFGFPVNNFSETAERHRKLRLCPFGNKVPNCTKDKANDPLGVCSIVDNREIVITCPVRFQEDWLIAEKAAEFFFPAGAAWTSLIEVRLTDKYGRSAGNIDLVLVAYDDRGRITDFASLEVQAVYISGNVRQPFEYFMKDPGSWAAVDWGRLADYYPSPDYLSSSRKRLVPQLIYKGSIFRTWHKKQAVAIQRSFYNTLPKLPEVQPENAELAWFLYDLVPNDNSYKLVFHRAVYTEFWPALNTITSPEAGDVDTFVAILQSKLDEKNSGTPPDLPQTIITPPLT